MTSLGKIPSINKPIYSYSQLNTFERCPNSWYKLYIEKVDRDSNAMASYGNLIHELLEKCAKGELEQERLADIFTWRFDIDVPEPFPKNKYVNLRDRYYQQGIKFFKNFEGFDGMKILGVEEHFVTDRGNYALQGYIDLLYVDIDGALVCRDWKSSKKYTRSQLDEHATQVYLYSSYCKEKLGRYPDRLEFFHFRDGNVRSVIQFDEDRYKQALEWADECVEKIRKTWVYDCNYETFFCANLCSCRSICEHREKERKKEIAEWRLNKKD